MEGRAGWPAGRHRHHLPLRAAQRVTWSGHTGLHENKDKAYRGRDYWECEIPMGWMEVVGRGVVCQWTVQTMSLKRRCSLLLLFFFGSVHERIVRGVRRHRGWCCSGEGPLGPHGPPGPAQGRPTRSRGSRGLGRGRPSAASLGAWQRGRPPRRECAGTASAGTCTRCRTAGRWPRLQQTTLGERRIRQSGCATGPGGMQQQQPRQQGKQFIRRSVSTAVQVGLAGRAKLAGSLGRLGLRLAGLQVLLADVPDQVGAELGFVRAHRAVLLRLHVALVAQVADQRLPVLVCLPAVGAHDRFCGRGTANGPASDTCKTARVR